MRTAVWARRCWSDIRSDHSEANENRKRDWSRHAPVPRGAKRPGGRPSPMLLRAPKAGYGDAVMAEQVLAGKVGLVFGVANKRSIAWAIAKAWAAAGAKLIFNYQGERLKENVEELVGEFGEGTPLWPCDVSKDEDITQFFGKVRGETDRVDLMLHSVAFAPKEALEGDFVSTTREAFRTAHDVSAYSLVALAREAAPLMTNGGSILAMTYYGSAKRGTPPKPGGWGKARPEAFTRYLSFRLGPKKNPAT